MLTYTKCPIVFGKNLQKMFFSACTTEKPCEDINIDFIEFLRYNHIERMWKIMDLTPLTQPINELTTPVAKSAGETLQDVWDLVFGGFGTFVDKKRAKREKDLMDFKATLLNEFNEIPEENIKEPQLSVIGPALEASKYYYEEPELRDMFAKLVAGSMDDRKNIHPCFIEIIKQLSPHDAKMLTLFSKVGEVPICNIYKHQSKENRTYNICKYNVFISSEYPNLGYNQLAIASLSKHSLISITYTEFFKDDNLYEEIKELTNVNEGNKLAGWEQYHVKKGIAQLTPLGQEFISVCL